MINVAHSKIVDKKTGLERHCKYSDVPKDEHQWVNDLSYRPIPFDLLFLKIINPARVKSGWWDGKDWGGLRLKKEDEVIAWKRYLYDYALS